MDTRVATAADADEIGDLLAASYAELLKEDYEPATLARALPTMSAAQPKLLASGSYYVAVIDGRIAACGGWTHQTPGSGEIKEGLGHIRHFATHPGFVRRGAAGTLLRRCIDEARMDCLDWLSAMSTHTAVKFYSAHGFNIVAEKTAEFPGGIKFPSVEMRLDLRLS